MASRLWLIYRRGLPRLHAGNRPNLCPARASAAATAAPQNASKVRRQRLLDDPRHSRLKCPATL